MANPNSSGTAYMAIATLVQIMGEDKALRVPEEAARQHQRRTRSSGSAPIKAVARGETTIGIIFMHDAVTEALAGFPVKTATPCEGTGYEIGSMSIIKGARNLANAKKFYDWALTPEAQKLGAAGQAVPGAVEQGDAAAARGAQVRRHQADRLRPGQVRLSRPSASACWRSGTARWVRLPQAR